MAVKEKVILYCKPASSLTKEIQNKMQLKSVMNVYHHHMGELLPPFCPLNQYFQIDIDTAEKAESPVKNTQSP